MASKDTGGQKRASKTSEEVEETEAEAATDVAERKEKLDRTSTRCWTRSMTSSRRIARISFVALYKRGVSRRSERPQTHRPRSRVATAGSTKPLERFLGEQVVARWSRVVLQAVLHHPERGLRRATRQKAGPGRQEADSRGSSTPPKA